MYDLLPKFYPGPRNPHALRWGIVALAATVLNFGLLYVLVGILGLPFAIAPLISAEACILLRFLANDRWVFGHRRPSWSRLGKYHLAAAGGFAAWWLISNALVQVGVHYLLASALAIAGSVSVGLMSNFAWVWRRGRSVNSLGSNQE